MVYSPRFAPGVRPLAEDVQGGTDAEYRCAWIGLLAVLSSNAAARSPYFLPGIGCQ
jgi:hypothetical protein